MKRVLVIGCAGARKTVFAGRLSDRTGLPIIHLDQEFWQAGWVPTAREPWRRHVEQLASRPRWIMDGQYGSSIGLRLKWADTVFFLDMPRWLCMSRVVRRTLRNYGRTRGDMASGCPERFDGEFMRYVWDYESEHRSRAIESLRGFHGDVIVLRSPSEVRAYLADVEPMAEPAPAT